MDSPVKLRIITQATSSLQPSIPANIQLLPPPAFVAKAIEAAKAAPPPAKKFRYQQGQVKSTESLYLNGEFADVHFRFGCAPCATTRVPAHKCILAGASDVFKAMFYGDLKESGDVHVRDASDAVFQEFLQFFYLAEVELSPENVAGVLDMGHKYNVKKCIDGCGQYLIDTLSDENACVHLATAIRYSIEQQQLLRACERHILMNTAAVFNSVTFLKCEKDILKHILDMPQLSCSEVEIFDACMAWVRSKSKQSALTKKNVQKYLGDLYYNVRFPLMTFQEFCSLEIKYEAVLSSDFKTIMRLMAQPGLKSKLFHTTPRRIEWNAAAIVKCNRENLLHTRQRFELSTMEMTTFTANQLLLLGKVLFD